MIDRLAADGPRPASGRGPSWHITLPYLRPPLTANETARGHNLAHARDRAEVRHTVAAVARSLRLPTLATAVVMLWWYPGRNGSVPDADNIAPTLKPCLDGLRDAGVLADDNARHVLLTAQRVVRLADDPFGARTPRVVLSVYDADGWVFGHPEPGPTARLTRLSDGSPPEGHGVH